MGKAVVGMAGRVFGRLTVIERTDRRSANGEILWRCMCECGNLVELRGEKLRSGHTKTCGCHARGAQPIHGKSDTPTHKAWRAMKQRCGNPKSNDFSNYGGRGIKVCERWESFQNFISDMGEKPPGMSIDRIDTDGNYEPGNCRWATQLEQQNNRRSNRMVLVNGESMTASMAARSAGLRPKLVLRRLHSGKSIEQALSLA